MAGLFSSMFFSKSQNSAVLYLKPKSGYEDVPE